MSKPDGPDGPTLEGEDNQLMSEEDAAKLLNISPRTLQGWRWAKHPEMPPFVVIGGKKIGYRRASLREYINSREQGPKPHRRALRQPKPGQKRALRGRPRSAKD